MLVSSTDLSSYRIQHALVEHVGARGYRGYRMILTFTPMRANYPLIRVHAFRTNGLSNEPLLIVRDLSDGHISVVAEAELLRQCKPLADQIFSTIKKRDGRIG